MMRLQEEIGSWFWKQNDYYLLLRDKNMEFACLHIRGNLQIDILQFSANLIIKNGPFFNGFFLRWMSTHTSELFELYMELNVSQRPTSLFPTKLPVLLPQRVKSPRSCEQMRERKKEEKWWERVRTESRRNEAEGRRGNARENSKKKKKKKMRMWTQLLGSVPDRFFFKPSPFSSTGGFVAYSNFTGCSLCYAGESLFPMDSV